MRRKLHKREKEHIALDNLNAGAVVLDQHGEAWQMGRGYSFGDGQYATGYWYRAYGDSTEMSSFELSQLGPFTLIHEGKR
jgi:hypothetical protein